ncbi:MAG: dihydropteroate synthase [Anaerolinea sp.]|nr:dihydropteroate synthase [Anaerolinea sp.]
MSGAVLSRVYRAPALELRGRSFTWGARTYLMAIINETPDSFSGDGLGSDVEAAVALARRFESEGADILDVGGESSRPGATPLAVEQEIERVVPPIAAIRAATTLPISVDTCHAAVAEAAIEAGANMVNDIWGLRHDPEMASVIARHGAALVAMHNQRGRPFRDVAGDIREGWQATLHLAHRAGIDPVRVILDPGFGFGWTPEQNLEMLRRLPELWDMEMPLLAGTSRKSTLGLVIDAPVEDRLEATASSVALSIAGGADIVRVHDVRAMCRVAKVADAVCRANWRAP